METEMRDIILDAVKVLKIDIKNMTGLDTIRLNSYIDLVYPNNPGYDFIIYGYKGEKRITIASHSMGKLDRYELFGYKIGRSGVSYSSATGVTTKYKAISYCLDGSEIDK